MKKSVFRFLRLSGLQRALLLYVVLPLLVIAGAGIAVGLDRMATLESDRLKDDVELIGRAIRLPIGEALAVNDEEAVRRTLQSVFDIGRIYGASVFDVNGNQVAAAGITERDLTTSQVAQQVVTTGEQQERYRQVSGMFLFSHFIPVFDDLGRTNGFIQINRRASDFDASLTQLSQTAWATWGVLCFATLAVVIFGHYGGVGRHVNALTQSMNRIERGERAHRADEAGPSELAELARGLNRMLNSIDNKDRELVQRQAHEEALAQQLQYQEKMAAIGRVAGGIAHELGAPLTVIDGRARRLLKDNQDPTQVRQLEAIRGQVARLTRIVRQLLNYTRAGSSDYESVQLRPLANDCVANLRHELTSDELQITLDVPDDLHIEADEARLELALINIIRNAAQSATREVSVAAVSDGDGVQIRVRDDGAGLPEGVDQAQLLEPFFSTKTQGEGTGLGLAIVHNVVTEHGGRVAIANHSAGGCEVTIWLPTRALPVIKAVENKDGE
ncbi:sensor histidine kinase [Aliidiomarina sedimenti]|uniref:sensor histidine kinase n=1 Tax=Aliidiomarina sedimenti TaxID=1933879 RepID=UPI001F543592|nr:HAMP domain-containing sensor histidine kinase [Aliidiomarina sedimenti]